MVLGLSLVGCASAKEGLARCLVEEGAVLYGTEWCPHCREQKELFEEGWEIMKENYVECQTENGIDRRCIDAGIITVPTWDFLSQRVFGVIPLEKFKDYTGCSYDAK